MLVMLHDLRFQTVVGAVVLLTGLAWCVLLAAAPLGGMLICGPGGVVPLILAWDGWRAVTLLAMWSLMGCAMMLPCATAEILGASTAQGDRNGIFLAVISFTVGYLGIVALAGSAGALVEWTLESAGAMQAGSKIADPSLRGGLLIVAGLAALSTLRRGPTEDTAAACAAPSTLLQGIRHGRSRLGSCVAMICLQFVGGAMDIAWMAVLAAWMLASAILPRTKQLSALAGFFLLAMASLSFAGTLP
jgi:predicted metal-binding membrane protein